MTRAVLLAQVAHVALCDADAIAQPYAWPPREMTADERHESERLRALSRRLSYAATAEGLTDQGTDAIFGGAS